MGFQSQDDLLNQITVNGKYGRIDYNKTTAVAGVAGTWTDLGTATGSIPANTYAGTSLTWVDTDDTWSEGAIYHGGDVSTATKHFLNASASVFAAAGAPWILMCIDQVGYVPITGADVTGTSERTVSMTAIGSSAAKRDRHANGVGLRAYFSAEVAPTGGGPNLTSFKYTDQAGNTAQNMTTAVGFAAAAGASAIEITPSGTIFSPIWVIGNTDVSLGITATLTGALWLNGTSDVSIAADGLLSGIGALSGAAWFALRARHFDLSHHQRVYVASVVESLYVKPIADQIISVATQNNLSVLDAAQVVVAKHGTAQLVVQNKRKVSALDKPVSVSAPKQERVVSNTNVYSVAEDKSLVACSESETEFVFSQLQTLTVSAETNQIFIQHKPKRSSLEQNGV